MESRIGRQISIPCQRNNDPFDIYVNKRQNWDRNLFLHIQVVWLQSGLFLAAMLRIVVEIATKFNSVCSNINGSKWRSGDRERGGAELQSQSIFACSMGFSAIVVAQVA